MIVVVNSGIGNISSIARMLVKCGVDPVVATDRNDLAPATKLLLPGVGAFDHGMKTLNDGGWIEALNEAVLHRRVPILGICLGMQLMCKRSEEGLQRGLGWIDADVRRFAVPRGTDLKIPHMGWNTVTVAKNNPLIPQTEGEQRFYFVHAYHAVCENGTDVLAFAQYGDDFTAAFSRGNVFGVQFHPEKSHRFGLSLLKRFVQLQC